MYEMLLLAGQILSRTSGTARLVKGRTMIVQTNQCWLHRALCRGSRGSWFTHYEVAIITRRVGQMTDRRTWASLAREYCLLPSTHFYALLPGSLYLSQKTELWTNILCEMSKQEEGKTFSIPVLDVLSRTFSPTLGNTKDKFMSKINVQDTAYWLLFLRLCSRSLIIMTPVFVLQLLPHLYLRSTLLGYSAFYWYKREKIGFVYTITSWCGLLWTVQILPQSF